MIYRLGFTIFIILTIFYAKAQDTACLKYSRTITREELSAHVYKLASDEMEGRFTGSRGIEKAEKYIRDEFRESGLTMPLIDGQPTFTQIFNLKQCRWKDQGLMVDNKEFKVGRDFLFLSDPVDVRGEFPVVFAGFGIDDPKYSDFGTIDVKNRIMLAFSGEPRDSAGNYRVSGGPELSRKGYYFGKAAMAADKGAAGVFIISRKRSDYRHYLKSRDYYAPKPVILFPEKDTEYSEKKQAFSAYLNVKTAARLVGERPKTLLQAMEEMERTGATRAGAYSGQVSIAAGSDCVRLKTANVVAMIEGAGQPGQAVVIVAHYDHEGIGAEGIYHGADDNASGTAALMEVAEAFALAAQDGYRPARSVIFLAVSAEELGLFGSRYYTMNPVISLDSTVACINIDMIGRVSSKLLDNPDYISATVYVSPDLLELAHEVNRSIVPEMEDRVEYRKAIRGGSDHYYFARSGIPSIFYFSGFHPDYHQPTDTADKILYPRMEKIVRAIFGTAWELANGEKKLEIGN